MKLASLKSEGRDGRLHLVSRDLQWSIPAEAAQTLQAALDDWARVAPELEVQYAAVCSGRIEGAQPFDPEQALAPLPRAHQWLDASSFLLHGRLLDRAFNIPPIPQADVIPIMYQGGSDAFLGPRETARFPDEADGIDFEAEFAVVLGDVPIGPSDVQADAAVRLVMLANDWSLRNLQRFEMMRGFGPIHAKPATAFAPVAVTPDELGEAWTAGRVERPVTVHWNGRPFGAPSGAAMDFHYRTLVQHAARTRELRAGAVLGFGTVSEGDPEKVGSACIAERRGFEIIRDGQPSTGFMTYGDTVRIECFGQDGGSIFGAIEQTVAPAVVGEA